MSSYRRHTSQVLLDASDNVVGVLGIDGRQWLFPAAPVIGPDTNLTAGTAPVLYDASGTPQGYVVGGVEYLFAVAFTLNTSPNVKIRQRALLLSSSGQPMGIKSEKASFGFPVPPTAGGGGGGTTPVDNFEFSSVGDSISNYANILASLNTGTTITRDTNGLVTIAKNGHGILGDSTVYLVNVLPTSLMIPGEGHFVDVNTYTAQTNVTGAPLLSTDVTMNPGGLVSALTLMAQSSGRGLPFHIISAFKGSAKYKGNFGQQGDTAEQMVDAVTKATLAVAPGMFVLIMAGINNISPHGTDTPAQAFAALKTLIDIITTNGRRALVCRVKPVGFGLASYTTVNTNVQATNALATAYCDGTTKIDIDTFMPTYDTTGSTNTSSPGTPCAYSWATVDSLHPSWNGSKLDSVPVIAALTPLVVSHDVLPVAYNDISPITWATYTRIVGPFPAAPGWATVTTGFLGNGSGVRPSAPFAWNTGSSTGSPTAVMSVVTPGGSSRPVVRVLHTFAAAGDRTRTYMDGNISGVTLATLGLSPGDKFRIGVELTWANYAASNCNLMALSCTASTFAAGLGGMLLTQAEAPASFESDSGSKYFFSGVMTVPSTAISTTAFTPSFFAGGSAASGSALQTDLGGVVWEKVTGVV